MSTTIIIPTGPSVFGKEESAEDMRARIEWERWAAAEQRRIGCEPLAQAHDLTRIEYEHLLARKYGS